MVNFAAVSIFCLLVQAAAVPEFKVDLDLPPEERWVSVVKHYKEEVVAMHKALGPILDKHLGADGKKDWLAIADKLYDSDIKGEIKGMTKALGQKDSEFQTQMFKLMNFLYEVESPTACSAVLWAAKDGTVYHGRNMDYGFHFKMPDGKVLNWPDVTFDAVFYKNGKPLFKSTMWPGMIGVATGMHFGGFSFQQNTRPGNDWHKNLDAAKKGGDGYLLFTRRLLENTDNFKTAVDKLYNAKLMAPSYFTLSGPGAYEGAVVTVDRLGEHKPETPTIQRLSSTGWHLVQTNDDITEFPQDPRRPVANAMLVGINQDIVNETNLMQFMHTPMLYVQGGTVYSNVMVPSRDYYKTVLPDEPPLPQEGFLAARGGSGALRGLSPDLQKKRKGLYKSLGKLTTDFEKGGMMAAMGDLAPLQAFMAQAKKEGALNAQASTKTKAKKAEKSSADTQVKSGCRGQSSLFSLLVVVICLSRLQVQL